MSVNSDKVRIYEMEMVEKISYTYYVPARSKAEAMRIANNEYYKIVHFDEFRNLDSHCHIEDQKPYFARPSKHEPYKEWIRDEFYHHQETKSLDHLEEIDKLDQGVDEE